MNISNVQRNSRERQISYLVFMRTKNLLSGKFKGINISEKSFIRGFMFLQDFARLKMYIAFFAFALKFLNNVAGIFRISLLLSFIIKLFLFYLFIFFNYVNELDLILILSIIKTNFDTYYESFSFLSIEE